LSHGLPALAIDCCLVLVVTQIVADNVVAVRVILVELVVGGLRGALLPLLDDIVGVEHGLVLSLCVQSELLLSTRISLGGRQLDHCLGELLGFQVVLVAGFLDFFDCGVGPLTEQDVHDFAPQVRSQHLLKMAGRLGIFIFI